MEYLVEIVIALPELDEAPSADLHAREMARGRELMADGKLTRIWRLPGQHANISLYEVGDATELHALLSSLPMWPYLTSRVIAIATHPLESEPQPG